MEYATLFPLDRICGRWKSRGKSPPVRVYREGHTYRIALAYRWGAVLTATLYRNGQGTWAELPERVQVAYDEDNERLVLASEGVYVRTARNTNIDKDILIINGHEKNTNSNLPYGLALHRHDGSGAMGDL